MDKLSQISGQHNPAKQVVLNSDPSVGQPLDSPWPVNELAVSFNCQSVGENHPSHSETAARATFESMAHRTFTDEEWQRARARWLEFVILLRHWQHQTEIKKVVIMPQVRTSESVLDKVA